MTRRERLIATLRGEPVDRLAVNFHEIGGFIVNPSDPDEYNIYNSPSWQPLLKMAENETDIIRMGSPVRAQSHLAWNGSDHTGMRDKLVKEKSLGDKGIIMVDTEDPICAVAASFAWKRFCSDAYRLSLWQDNYRPDIQKL
jgi:hypothetical protein